MIHRELVVPNDTQYLVAVREEVTKVVEQSAFTKRDRKLIIVAVDEAVTNIMEHAYEDDLEGELFIEIVLEVSAGRFSAVIRDWGKVFDPTKVPAPDLKAHVNEGRRHGLGIFLMKQIMDEVTYTSFPDGRNDLCMVRHAGGGSASGDGKAADPEATQARANEA